MNVELMYWGYSLAESSLNVPAHRHHYWQSSFACSGECVFALDGGRKITVRAGEILLLPPGTEHALYYSSAAPYRSYTFKFRCDRPVDERVIHLAAGARTQALLGAVDLLMRSWFPPERFGDPCGAVVLPEERYAAVIEGLLAGLLDHELASSSVRPWLDPVRAVLRSRPRLTVGDAAAIVKMTRNAFSARLKRETGLGAKEWLDRELVRTVRRYLEYSELRIGEIACLLGFPDVFALDAFFHRRTGMTPGECRRRSRD